MKNLLIPKLYVDSIFDINLDELKKRGIKNLIVDIDNTLVAWDKKTAPRSVIQWFDEVKKKGFNICLVSNNTEDRVVKFTENIEIAAFHRAKKPFKTTFYKAMNYMKANKKNTAVIGDQIFTDILGGNRVGLYTILVVPIESKEFWWTQLVRKIERFILKKIKKGYN
ncbi:YqeG family HAD IIIA-type phosphatase [Caminicella sporogenes]|uniref:YqeG family HAD IIIA-type phosphatase n=1 Tax=Caminicella sporogenes TaxID=166485 RepID=UPI0025401285|nr:YqeG family HAD IIIA-type phosphatase [Caminicella sporogenes]WIF95191.1 YqeG family HAD IIIA-type phosphatase [Caminicella sporogenes]